jgi:hypothetical protein
MRLVISQIIAALTLVVAFDLYTLGLYDSSLSAGDIGRSSALIGIALSIVAFVTSLKLRSGVVAGLLIAGVESS